MKREGLGGLLGFGIVVSLFLIFLSFVVFNLFSGIGIGGMGILGVFRERVLLWLLGKGSGC